MPLLVATQNGLHDIEGGTVAFEGRDVTVAAPREDGSIWALVGLEELWRDDELVAKVPIEYGTALAVGRPGVVVGTAGAHLLRLDGHELVPDPAFDTAPTRDDWHTPSGGAAAVRSATFGADGALYVNVHVGGILRSTDDRAWDATIDLYTDVHHVVADDGALFAALGDGGLATSDDRGDSWTIRTTGLHAPYARAVAALQEHVLLSASSGPFATDGALYRIPRAGDAFEPVEGGLPGRFPGNIDTGWVAAAGTRAAVAGPDGDVFESADSGRTWQLVASGLPTPRWVALSPG